MYDKTTLEMKVVSPKDGKLIFNAIYTFYEEEQARVQEAKDLIERGCCEVSIYKYVREEIES
jgi:hypothetical protein